MQGFHLWYTTKMEALLTDLLEYAEAIAAAKCPAPEGRRDAWRKLENANPALSELLVCIVADEWGQVAVRIRELMHKN